MTLDRPSGGFREAAVLVPVYRGDEGELRLVLVRRAEGGEHGGQVAFPGGKRDPADRSLEETAVREAREEIGIAPESVVILERLPEVLTGTTRYRIVPFLARIVRPQRWFLDELEIAEVLDAGVEDFARPGAHGEELMHFPSWPEPRRVAFFRVGPYRLWGASFGILEPLLPRLRSGEWEIR